MSPFKVLGITVTLVIALACFAVGKVLDSKYAAERSDAKFFSIMAYIGVVLWCLAALAILTA